MFQVESDLHLEFRLKKDPRSTRSASGIPKLEKFLPRKAGVEYLLLAGDICPVKHYRSLWTEFLQYCSVTFPQTLIVAGNHEYYGGSRDWVDAELRSLVSAHGNVHFLQRAVYTDDRVTVAGCTLWSRTDRPVPMNDYETIVKDGPSGSTITHLDTLAWHTEDRQWLEGVLSASTATVDIVLTHHLPSYRAVAPRYSGDPCNIAFATDLDHLCALVPYWVCGHTHTPRDLTVNTCRVIINPRGYPGETQYRPKTFGAGTVGRHPTSPMLLVGNPR